MKFAKVAAVYFAVLSVTTASENSEEEVAVEMELTLFDLQDLRDTITRSKKDAVYNNNFKEKVRVFVFLLLLVCVYNKHVCLYFIKNTMEQEKLIS